jgi:hypothetical protein
VKVVYTDAVLHDLDEITVWLKAHYPGVGNAVEILHIHHAARAPWDEPA